MSEIRRYLIVCSCTGSVNAVAYLNDERPTGGGLAFDANPDQFIMVTPELAGGSEPADAPTRTEAMFNGHNVTRIEWTRWGSRTTWVVRCMDCDKQVQMAHDPTFVTIADELAAQTAAAVVPVPSPHRADLIEDRQVIPLGVLVRIVGRIGR